MPNFAIGAAFSMGRTTDTNWWPRGITQADFVPNATPVTGTSTAWRTVCLVSAAGGVHPLPETHRSKPIGRDTTIVNQLPAHGGTSGSRIAG